MSSDSIEETLNSQVILHDTNDNEENVNDEAEVSSTTPLTKVIVTSNGGSGVNATNALLAMANSTAASVHRPSRSSIVASLSR